MGPRATGGTLDETRSRGDILSVWALTALFLVAAGGQGVAGEARSGNGTRFVLPPQTPPADEGEEDEDAPKHRIGSYLKTTPNPNVARPGRTPARANPAGETAPPLLDPTADPLLTAPTIPAAPGRQPIAYSRPPASLSPQWAPASATDPRSIRPPETGRLPAGAAEEAWAPELPDGAVPLATRAPGEWQRILAVLANPRQEDRAELTKMIFDPTEEYAAQATGALASLGGPEAETVLRRAWTVDRPEVRGSALAALAMLNPPPADMTVLCRAGLSDPDRLVRAVAAEMAGRLKLSSLIDLLRELVRQYESPAEWRTSLWALGQMGDTWGLELLAAAAEDEKGDLQLAQWACVALGDSGSSLGLPILYRKLYSRNLGMVSAAYTGLNRISPAAHAQFLAESDGEDAIGWAARRALLRFSAEGGPPPAEMDRLLLTGTEQERMLAIRGFGEFGGMELFPLALVTLTQYEAARYLPFGPDGRMTVMLRQAMARAATRGGLPESPGDLGHELAWRRWWFRQFRSLDIEGGKVILRSPGGWTLSAAVGDELLGGARVTGVTGEGVQRATVAVAGETIILRRQED